uniref:hypothetical protein n=1 Tax=Erythrolobus coxiae TaxID=362235 RepID=UPI001FCCDA85|nr:hypothetical protein MW556_pgp052 [Erythrolobus coxiae]UNJ17755.1 hypothetical protein [Erythrolobus coxiae]
MLIADDLDKLYEVLPTFIKKPLENHPKKETLVEVIMDLGRRPEARFPDRPIYLSSKTVDWIDLDFCIKQLGNFSGENRAGIERTLHRISSVRNRDGSIVGLTCRVGRAVFGTINIIRDLLETQKSILLLGKPGVGKTTAIREIARVLADELQKRVVIIDTSNEIAGDGDIPHRSIGRARRMQVSQPELQHHVMIEAVENHMPEVIIIDEIGTELETFAARTIAERGVQLVGTAHGNYLESIIKNPTLSDLIGGIQYVTLGDEEAKRRKSQKSILERKATPAFSIAIEIHERYCWIIHENIQDTVDQILNGINPDIQVRKFNPVGETSIRPFTMYQFHYSKYINNTSLKRIKNLSIYTIAINYQNLEKIINTFNLPIELTRNLSQATNVLALKSQIRHTSELINIAQSKGIQVYSIKSNFITHILRILFFVLKQNNYDIAYDYDNVLQSCTNQGNELEALEETRLAIERIVIPKQIAVELIPRPALVRKIQYDLIKNYDLKIKQFGKEPHRRLRILF